MAENSSIEWTDHTFNPWEGCTRVSPGCLNCYAETRNHRFGMDNWGKGKPRRRTSASNWKEPVKWNKAALAAERGWAAACEMEASGIPIKDELAKVGLVQQRRPRVFCASLADWLDDEVPIEWLADLLKLIRDTPNIDWLLLTKRPGLWLERIQAAKNNIFYREGGTDAFLAAELWLDRIEPPANVWIGTSVEDQKRAEERIPELLKIPAKIRFLSVEPMLGPVDLTRVKFPTGATENVLHNSVSCRITGHTFPLNSIDWAIFGGESGRGARPCNIEWIRNGVEQCRAAGVSPFVKQIGAAARYDIPAFKDAAGIAFAAINNVKHPPLRDKKGGEMAEWPDDLRVREFPAILNLTNS